MNTKAYLRLFGELAEKDEIPRDLYDTVVAEIAKDGKMTKRVYSLYLQELEKRRLFDVDGAPFDTRKSAKTDGTYVYKHTKNPFWHIAHAIWCTLFKWIGFIGAGVVFGIWRVKDRKKIKKLGACITTANHVGYLDGVLTLRATGMKKRYIVVAPHNCKSNVGGAILRRAGVIPLPISLKGARPFNDMLEYVAERGAAIHFYPEKSMWIGYEKPRPYKDGAFYYADKLNIPVVPMLYCFKKPRGLRKLLHLPKAAIRIAEPIYIDKSLPPRERKADMSKRAFDAAAELYERFYGKPLEYLAADEPQTSDSVMQSENTLKDER